MNEVIKTQVKEEKVTHHPVKQETVTDNPVKKKTLQAQKAGTCLGLKKDTPPLWIMDSGTVVTRFFKTCMTNYGGKGYLSNSPEY